MTTTTTPRYLRGGLIDVHNMATSTRSPTDLGDDMSEVEHQPPHHHEQVQGTTSSTAAAAHRPRTNRVLPGPLPLVSPSILEQAKQMALDQDGGGVRDDGNADDDDDGNDDDEEDDDTGVEFDDDGALQDDEEEGADAKIEEYDPERYNDDVEAGESDEDQPALTVTAHVDDDDGFEDDGVVPDDSPEDSAEKKTQKYDYAEKKPQKYDYLGKIKGQNGPPYLPKDVVGMQKESLAPIPEQMKDPVVLPAIPSASSEPPKKEKAKTSDPIAPRPPVMQEEGDEEGIESSSVIIPGTVRKKPPPAPFQSKDTIGEVYGGNRDSDHEHMHKGKHDKRHKHAKGEVKEEMKASIAASEEHVAVRSSTTASDDNDAEDDVAEENLESEENENEKGATRENNDNFQVNDGAHDGAVTSHDNEDDDDDRVSTDEKQPSAESVPLTRNSAKENKKAPYVHDEPTESSCDKASSISAIIRCKTAAVVKYHTFAFSLGCLLILVFLYYRRKRRASAGRRSRRFGAKNQGEYARIIQEYDDLEGTFDDDLASLNDDNETMSTWSDGDIGGPSALEMQNFRGSDDKLGMHEMNG